MTWTKLGAEFWDQCAEAGLSDAAVRTHCEGIGWLYGLDRDDLADLSIPKHLVRRFAGSPDWETGVKELVASGFWKERGSVYVVVHHGDVVRSSLAAQRAKRERDKKAQRTKRRKAKSKTASRGGRARGGTHVSDDVSADVVATQTDRQTRIEEQPHTDLSVRTRESTGESLW